MKEKKEKKTKYLIKPSIENKTKQKKCSNHGASSKKPEYLSKISFFNFGQCDNYNILINKRIFLKSLIVF